MFRSNGEEVDVVMVFLAGEGEMFERFVISVGESLLFGGLVICFFPWAFLIETKLGPVLN
jgi:hypothetical protein